MADRPQSYTVSEVAGDNKIRLEGYGDVLDVVPPKGSPLPPLSVGQELTGWFNAEGKFGPYLKLAAERSNGSQSRSGGSSDDFARRPEHVRNEARMVANAALSSAPTFYDQLATFGLLGKPASQDEYWQAIHNIAERIESRIRRKMDDTESDLTKADARIPF